MVSDGAYQQALTSRSVSSRLQIAPRVSKRRHAGASSAASVQSPGAARAQELNSGSSLYNPGLLPAAFERLLESGAAERPSLHLDLWQGTWEVVYAPHIARMSSVLNTRFMPIRYVLEGTKLASNVRFSSSLFKEGWLSAAGILDVHDAGSVQVLFDQFWVDLNNDLRPQPPGGDPSAELSSADRVLKAIGRALFFPQFSIFPVLYINGDLAVFQFTPIKSNIAVRRVG